MMRVTRPSKITVVKFQAKNNFDPYIDCVKYFFFIFVMWTWHRGFKISKLFCNIFLTTSKFEESYFQKLFPNLFTMCQVIVTDIKKISYIDFGVK